METLENIKKVTKARHNYAALMNQCDASPDNVMDAMDAHDPSQYISLHGFDLPTPHMRVSGERATLFRNCHCAAPTCSPSPAALLTGETAQQAGSDSERS